jgi:DNA (cytosine-5)-methyltransferase 1
VKEAVDLLCGWGGFSLAAEQAGVRVVWAGNHWQTAVDAHQLNHPHTAHVCQDLRQADWTSLPRFDLLLASPACQGHSTASQPNRRAYHDAMRATAWAVVDCADATEPRAILVENVLSFRRWRLYPQWRAALEALGFYLTELVVTASRHGAPQRRTRLFIVATRRPRAGAFRDLHDAARTLVSEPAFGPCIDWTAGRWRPRVLAPPGARARMSAAVAAHGSRCLSQHVTGHPGVGLDEPIRTITTKDQWVVIDGENYRPLTVRETARAMGFPESYAWPETTGRRDQIIGLGNAVSPPPARRIIGRLAEVA